MRKGVVANGSQRRWKFDADQCRAVLEGEVADFFERRRQGDANQRRAVVEGVVGDGGDIAIESDRAVAVIVVVRNYRCTKAVGCLQVNHLAIG